MKYKDHLLNRIEPGKQRITKQRVLILEELRKVTSHPSAHEIYEMVRPKLPNISFGTVYRNLKFLQRLNLLQELNYGKRFSRFDGNPQDHYHIVCRECDRVDDVPSEIWNKLNKEVEGLTQYEIRSHRIEFYGLCPRCKKKKGGRSERVE